MCFGSSDPTRKSISNLSKLGNGHSSTENSPKSTQAERPVQRIRNGYERGQLLAHGVDARMIYRVKKMNSISQQLLIAGTVLFLLSLLGAFAIPFLANPRMGVSAHVAGIESGLALWGLGLMWHYLALPASVGRAAQITAVAGLYAIFISLFLAALWGTSRATPVAGAGHQGSPAREMIVTMLLTGGSLASVVAFAFVLWGLCAWKAGKPLPF